jgi:2-amino-4-hydroxy-6-hydroxymethyldihydropteridine diphosphokinase
MSSRVLAIIALGSNVGDSQSIVSQAMARLELLSSEPLRKSSLWQTTPVDCPPGSPPFVNAVVAITPRPGETPESVLEKLLALEKEFGRKPKLVRNEPRRLDLDLIAFDRETRLTKALVLPHPRAHERRFVLQPLCEFAPEFILPGQAKTAAELLSSLDTREKLVPLGY